MQCKELQYRDWVTDEHGFPMQITNVGEDYAYATFEGNEGDPWEFDDKDDQPKPIPLTAEILETNGFVLRRKTYILKWRGAEIHWRKTDGYASITAPNNLKLEGWCSIPNGYFCYVHTLQHALRFCGLIDLADNFKV